MHDHVHGIIVMTGVVKGGSRTAPTEKREPIGRLIGAFKTVSTKRINQLRNTPGLKIWQRNYYEHIIRDDDELNRIREYIVSYSAQWETDRENPNVGVGAGFQWEFIALDTIMAESMDTTSFESNGRGHSLILC